MKFKLFFEENFAFINFEGLAFLKMFMAKLGLFNFFGTGTPDSNQLWGHSNNTGHFWPILDPLPPPCVI
jgi:hypothetical protein